MGFATRGGNDFGNSIGRANRDGTGVDQGFVAAGFRPDGIAVDGAYVYWTNPQSDSIGRASLDGSGANPSFITGAGYPRGLTVDETHVYWSNYTSGTIGRADLDAIGRAQAQVGPLPPRRQRHRCCRQPLRAQACRVPNRCSTADLSPSDRSLR